MSTDLLVVTQEQRELVKKTIAPDATDSELELFFYDNKRRGVHPLDKLIHFTKRKGRYVPVTSIHFMRAKADEGGRAGQDPPVFSGPEGVNGYSCSITVHKVVGVHRVPYVGTAKWKEYFPGDGEIGFMWRKMPSHMLAKCAEANALRLAFPRELAGLHVQEEVHILDEVTIEESQGANQAPPTLKDRLKAKLDPVEQDDAREPEDIDTPPVRDAVPFNPEVCPPPDRVPTLDAANIAKQFRLAESIAEWAAIANQWQEEVDLHTDEDRAMVKKVADEAKKRIGKR